MLSIRIRVTTNIASRGLLALRPAAGRPEPRAARGPRLVS